MEMTVRPTTPAESMYTYTQSTQIEGQTGCIGHLRADMDSDGKGFYSTWDDHRGNLKTDEFKAEFDEVINRLRFGIADEKVIRNADADNFLANRTALAKYCQSKPEARINGEAESYGFRVDTENYTYMMRLNPNKGEYNLYCYCYNRNWLEDHMKNAERGIRFIDSSYNTLFRIPDGGRIQITYPNGEVRKSTCRYIDDYHLELGSSSCNLFHICEFAERMENIRATVEPLDAMPEAEKRAKQKNRGEAR